LVIENRPGFSPIASNISASGVVLVKNLPRRQFVYRRTERHLDTGLDGGEIIAIGHWRYDQHLSGVFSLALGIAQSPEMTERVREMGFGISADFSISNIFSQANRRSRRVAVGALITN